MANYGMYGLAAASDATRRQKMQTFAADSSQDTARSIGVTECDAVGAAVAGRTAHGSLADTATVADAEALAAYTGRRRLHLQNLSSTVTLRYWWGALSAVKFELDPRETLTLTGADCPADALSVDTASGSAAFVAVDW